MHLNTSNKVKREKRDYRRLLKKAYIFVSKIKTLKNKKLFLFKDHLIVYVENPKVSAKNLLKLINEFNEFAGYRSNIQQLMTFLYTKQLNMRIIKNHIHISNKNVLLKNKSAKICVGSVCRKL